MSTAGSRWGSFAFEYLCLFSSGLALPVAGQPGTSRWPSGNTAGPAVPPNVRMKTAGLGGTIHGNRRWSSPGGTVTGFRVEGWILAASFLGEHRWAQLFPAQTCSRCPGFCLVAIPVPCLPAPVPGPSCSRGSQTRPSFYTLAGAVTGAATPESLKCSPGQTGAAGASRSGLGSHGD